MFWIKFFGGADLLILTKNTGILETAPWRINMGNPSGIQVVNFIIRPLQVEILFNITFFKKKRGGGYSTNFIKFYILL